MSIKSFLSVSVTAFLLLCCGKENGGPDPIPGPACVVNEFPDTYFDSGSYTVTYDENGRVAAIKQFSFNLFTFTYDANGRVSKFKAGVSQLEGLGGEEHTVTYDASGRIATIEASTEDGLNGTYKITATPTYDAQNRVTKMTVTDPKGTVYDYTKRMEYDNAGNVTKVYLAREGEAEKLVAEYTYDAKKSPFAEQKAFQFIPLISSQADKSHYLSPNNPAVFTGTSYNYSASYQYTNDLPAQMTLALKKTGDPAPTSKQKEYKYTCK
ncbi:hypothetical protein [Larkinella soli]|uniref:hypothetical protein n=1 Tax=Larkinella soli TaxID=1770527 RepID=UPI000FFC859C|nr:hypothetical protein [Larkinella soli]